MALSLFVPTKRRRYVGRLCEILKLYFINILMYLYGSHKSHLFNFGCTGIVMASFISDIHDSLMSLSQVCIDSMVKHIVTQQFIREK